MATNPVNEVIEHLRRTVLLQEGEALTDGPLLKCFVSSRERAALEAAARMRK